MYGRGAARPIALERYVDEKSFESLALPHLDSVYRFARRLTGDEHEAEDLVQDTFLRAYKAFGNFQLREFGVRPWLLKILHNTFLNRQAKIKRTPRSADQQTLEEIQEDERPGAVFSDEPVQLDFEALDSNVKHALEALSPEFRSILLLWATMELSYQEIAEVLSIPIGTVMSRLHRARQQVLQSLRAAAPEGPSPREGDK